MLLGLELLAVGECQTGLVAQSDVSVVDGIEHDEVHFEQVRLTVVGEVTLVGGDVDDFGYEVVAGGRFVNLAFYAALKSHREVGKERSVDVLGP